MGDEKRSLKRSEIDEKYKWAINDIYATDEKWYEDLEKLKGYIQKTASYKGKLSQSADTLYDYLQMGDEISVLCDSLINYAQRKSDEDTTQAKYQNMTGQVTNVLMNINSAGSFETPEIIAIEQTALEKMFEQKPGLEMYRRKLDLIRDKKDHVLSEAEERIIALTSEMGESAENIYSMFSNADMKFPDAVDKDGKSHQVTHSTYIPLVQSSDRVLRRSAFESMYSTFDSFKNTCAATLDAQIKAVNFYSKARNYKSSLESSLSDNEIPTRVYHNLISAVHDNLHYMYDYVALRKKLMGVDELHFYDLYTTVVSDFDIKINFEQA
ncbi:MAG: oligoendopeptidase F, partial [Ruminococcus sp.]|nr:oligoendopeptidase F [Ruminococcus sp.]